jgi:hypothetical protein
MYFSALQTKGIIAINCKVKGSNLVIELLIVDNISSLNTIQALYASLPEERAQGSLRVKIPNIPGLSRDQTLEICP